MEKTTVVFNDDDSYGEVQLFSNTEKAGRMDISVSNGKLRVYHTEINIEYEGRGFAKLLLHQLVSYARQNNLKIIPLCPYVYAEFKRHPKEYEDVWLSKRLNSKI